MVLNTPFTPQHSVEWLEKFFKDNYYKKPYDRFSWWRSYTVKNKPLHKRKPLEDKIKNGDFDISSYKFEAELVEHKINQKYQMYINDQGRYIEETSLDRARRKRLLQDFEKEESNKIAELIQEFTYIVPLNKEQVTYELENFDGTLIQFYHYITKKYARKTNKQVKL